MAKASLKLQNGTVVTLGGHARRGPAPLGVYAGEGTRAPTPAARAGETRTSKTRASSPSPSIDKSGGKPDLNQIVTLAKDCNEAEVIEKQILDRAAQVDRTLLALYIVHECLDNAFGLTSGEVKKITTDLGIPISQPNASRTLDPALPRST